MPAKVDDAMTQLCRIEFPGKVFASPTRHMLEQQVADFFVN